MARTKRKGTVKRFRFADYKPATIYFAPDEYGLIADKATVEGRGFSAQTRLLIRQALGLGPFPLQTKPAEELKSELVSA